MGETVPSLPPQRTQLSKTRAIHSQELEDVTTEHFKLLYPIWKNNNNSNYNNRGASQFSKDLPNYSYLILANSLKG